MTVHAMPVMLIVLAILAIAYRYYSAFLAARVAVLDDSADHARPIASTTARTLTRPTAGCCSAIISRRSRRGPADRPGAGDPVRLPARAWSGWSSASAWPARSRT